MSNLLNTLIFVHKQQIPKYLKDLRRIRTKAGTGLHLQIKVLWKSQTSQYTKQFIHYTHNLD